MNTDIFKIEYAEPFRDEVLVVVQLLSQADPDSGTILVSKQYGDIWEIGGMHQPGWEAYRTGTRSYFLAPQGEFRMIEEGEIFCLKEYRQIATT